MVLVQDLCHTSALPRSQNFFLKFFFAKERASRKVARRERKMRYELVYYASTQIIICDNYLL